ncbi:MDR family MFS transporter [Kitasatospora sp. NPDC056531]|uniref:MDR family MFS transporter n=1 Tax=Kitasatospora sp. NPDC056531 TaxID=3345856 RepID=UPI0036ACCD3F
MPTRPARAPWGLPGPFWWLWGGTLVTSAGGFVVPFMAIYLTTVRGYSVFFTGLTLTTFGVGSGIASLFGGILADRIGRRTVLLASEVLTVTGMLGLGLTHGRAPVLLFTLTVGVGLNATRPARAAAVADLVTPEDLPRAYALIYWATNLGFSAAAVTAGLAASHGFLLLFLVNALANLLAGVMVYLRVPETRPPPGTGRAAGAAGAAGAVHRAPAFLVLLGSVLLLGLIFQQPLVALPLAMTADGLSAADYGAAMMMNGLVIAVLQLPLTRLAGRLRPEHALAAATLVTGLGMGLTAGVHGTAGYGATVVLWSLGEIVVWPTCMALVAVLSPPGRQGGYQGWFLSTWSVSVALAPVLSGRVIEASGTATVWGACSCLAVVCAGGHLLLARLRGDRRAEAVPGSKETATFP